MSKKPSRLRAHAEQVYALTDTLQVQLKVLEATRVPIDVQVNPFVPAVPAGDLDVEVMAFLVLMQAARSAQEDLKAIMEQLKSINTAKEELRCVLDKAHSPKPVRHGVLDFESVFHLMAGLYAKQLEAETDLLLASLDPTSEMGEMESLRLQMAMDRLGKLMSTLSNLLKKISDASSQITQNLK